MMVDSCHPGSWAVAALLVSVLCMTSFQSCNAQGISVRYQNQFQCWPQIAVSGIPVPGAANVNATSPDDCARKCLATPGCTFFTLSTSLMCSMKYLPFDALYGSTGRDPTVMTSCVLKSVGGSLPSPANTMCYSGQDIAGNLIANTGSVSSSTACATLCVATPGCSFSVFRAMGMSGNGTQLCSLKSNAFAGVEPPTITRRDPLVTGLCLRAIPAPEIIDPLLAIAGPIPFLISTQGSNMCLRPASSPYFPGQPLLFSSDCTNGAEPLWTYDGNTQIVSHYASGLCLAPTDSSSGAAVVLSADCGPASGNRAVSRGSGSLHILYGARWLVPVYGTASEGAAMVAVTDGIQSYNFWPVPSQAYECFSGVNIPGDLAYTFPNTTDTNNCAALCVSNPSCTFFTYDNSSNCYLKYNPFTTGEVTQSGEITAACLSRGPPSGAAPSPANNLCYTNQRVSGNSIMTLATRNPMRCSQLCDATYNCTYSLYTFDGMCTVGSDTFFGDQGNADNRVDYDVIQLCLHAQGAPQTVLSKGYTCFEEADINGDQIGEEMQQVPSLEICATICELASEICTLAVYNNQTQTCVMRNNAFGVGGQASRAGGETSCLRSASGGSKNSPADFMCFDSQSVSGTEISTQQGVADTSACATLCAATQGCTLATYTPSNAATCVLKSDAFYGTEDPTAYTRADPSVAVCLAAPGAPQVLSSFGVPEDDTAFGLGVSSFK